MSTVFVLAPALADTAVFGENTGDSPGGTVRDTQMTGGAGHEDKNWGASAVDAGGAGFFGAQRTIIFADMSSIPTTATVTSATLTLTHKHDSCAGHDGGIEEVIWAYKINSAHAGWVEGTQNGVSETGSPDWNHRAHSTSSWNTAGLGTSDYDSGDQKNAGYGTGAGAGWPTGVTTVTFTITNWVQGWVSTPSSNAGVFLRKSGEAWDRLAWHSSEGTDGSRPYFTVNYTTPAGGPSAIETIQVSSEYETIQTSDAFETVQIPFKQ